MPRARHESHSVSLVHPTFWVPSAGAVLLVPAAWLGMPVLPLALFGVGIGALTGVLVAWKVREWLRTARSEERNLPPEFATAPDLARLYQILREVLFEVAARPVGSERNALTQKLLALGVQFRGMASGTASFTGTASWYVAHDAVLAVPGLREYRALVRVDRADRVQSPAELESLRVAFAAVRRGVLVERVLVLPDALWPPGQRFPAEEIRPWIEEQHNHGHRVILLRESDPVAVPHLSADTCVFDTWAVGTRDLDKQSQTARVTLDFNTVAVQAALERLDRLSLLGISYRELLARAERSE